MWCFDNGIVRVARIDAFESKKIGHRVSSDKIAWIRATRTSVSKHIQSEITYLFASPFPDDKYTNSAIKFIKDEDDKCRIDPTVFRQLWDRSCIEVDNLPPPDLQNQIHPIFAHTNFPDLADAEYTSITNAVTLASRFITDPKYLDFWVKLSAGRPKRKRDAAGNETKEYYLADPTDNSAGSVTENILRTATALQRIAPRIKFFNMDQTYSEADEHRVAETFMTPDDYTCRRHEVLNVGESCKTCRYCRADARGICSVCACRKYRRFTSPELKDVQKTRDIAGRSRITSIAAVRAVLEAEDDAAGTLAPTRPVRAALIPGRFAPIKIGLHWDMITSLRDQAKSGSTWTDCEKLRFHFSLAATLVHELAHAFWFYAQRRCWSCFGADPWFSEHEVMDPGPEIGNSWEYWAFGTRVPRAAKVRIGNDKSVANLFQQTQWTYSDHHPKAGQSKTLNDIVTHDFILPVEYVHSWFQESTWAAINNRGRLGGRPDYQSAVIMREEATKLSPKTKQSHMHYRAIHSSSTDRARRPKSEASRSSSVGVWYEICH